MKFLRLAVLVMMSPLVSRADATVAETNVTAETVLARVLANRALKDFALKARLFVTREQTVPVDILVKNSPAETRTIYRAGNMRLLVIQPAHGVPRYYLQGEGELTGKRRTQDFLGSHFSCYDLGIPFLQWPNPKLVGEDRVMGRDCFLVEARASGEPYARVKLWIDKEYNAFLRAESFDENDNLARRFSITSFKRINDVWIPRGMEIAFVPLAQSLPSQEKSRLEVYDGTYDAQLPADQFSPAAFGAGAGGSSR